MAAVDPVLMSLLVQRFGNLSDATLLDGGFSHLTFSVETSDRRLVVKAARSEPKRADVRNEADLLFELGPVDGVPVPRIVSLVESDEWTAVITPFIMGEPGLELVKEPPADLADRAAVLGGVYRRLHAAGFSHGDAGFHNTIWWGIRLGALLDWEWGRRDADPLGDLAWFWWTTAFRRLAPAVWERFAAAYGSRGIADAGWSADAVQPVVRTHMEMIRSRAEKPEAKAEWDARIAALSGLAVPGVPDGAATEPTPPVDAVVLPTRPG